MSVPVIANGGILESNEAQFCLEFTGVDAIMVGEGMLANPAMFAEKPMDICTLSEQYLELCAEHISSFVTHSMRGHLAHLLHRSLSKYPDIAEELSRCISFRAFHNTVTTLRQRLQDLDPAEQLGHLHPGFAQAALPAYWSYEHNMLSSIRQHRFPGDQDQVCMIAVDYLLLPALSVLLLILFCFMRWFLSMVLLFYPSASYIWDIGGPSPCAPQRASQGWV